VPGWLLHLVLTLFRPVPAPLHVLPVQGVFQHLAHHFSPHLWPWMITQHALVLAALASLNTHMCSASATLRAGYAALRSLLPPRLASVLCVALSPSARTNGSTVVVPPSCSTASWAVTAASGTTSLQLCAGGQLVAQVLLGCLLPLWLAYSTEARQRKRWVLARRRRVVMAGGSFLDYLSFTMPLLCAVLSLHANRVLPLAY